jgi:Xaa-Pro aminopeptidase/Xaa-Pro dipeptidase
MNPPYSGRRSAVLLYAQSKGFDGVLVGEPQNLYYLTGFWGEAFVVLTPQGTSLVVPALELDRAQSSVTDTEVVASDRGPDIYKKVKEKVGNNRMLTDDIPASTFALLSEILPTGTKVDPDALLISRRVKDEAEIELMVQGGRVMDRLYDVTAEILSPGVDERTVAGSVLDEMVRLRADPPAYSSTLNPLIVATGANGSLPHAYTTDRKVERGDFVVCDYVLRFGGYVVDATRTFAVGSPTPEMVKAYDAVFSAQAAGLEATRVGAKTDDVDRACRGYLERRGLGQYFVHGTGHGIGLDVHEPPWVRKDDKEVLKRNVAITVEPGVYMSGRFGVRIEDSVIVADRPLVLTRYTKELLNL